MMYRVAACAVLSLLAVLVVPAMGTNFDTLIKVNGREYDLSPLLGKNFASWPPYYRGSLFDDQQNCAGKPSTFCRQYRSGGSWLYEPFIADTQRAVAEVHSTALTIWYSKGERDADGGCGTLRMYAVTFLCKKCFNFWYHPLTVARSYMMSDPLYPYLKRCPTTRLIFKTKHVCKPTEPPPPPQFPTTYPPRCEEGSYVHIESTVKAGTSNTFMAVESFSTHFTSRGNSVMYDFDDLTICMSFRPLEERRKHIQQLWGLFPRDPFKLKPMYTFKAELFMMPDGSLVYYEVYSGIVWASITALEVVSPDYFGEWHEVCVRRDKNTGLGHIDFDGVGVAKGQVSKNLTYLFQNELGLVQNEVDLRVGQGFVGDVDEMAIWFRPLTLAETTKVMARDPIKLWYMLRESSEPTLAGYFPFSSFDLEDVVKIQPQFYDKRYSDESYGRGILEGRAELPCGPADVSFWWKYPDQKSIMPSAGSMPSGCPVSGGTLTVSASSPPGPSPYSSAFDGVCALPINTLNFLPYWDSLVGYSIEFDVAFTGQTMVGRHGGFAIGRRNWPLDRWTKMADFDWIERPSDNGLRIHRAGTSHSTGWVTPPVGHSSGSAPYDPPTHWSIAFNLDGTYTFKGGPTPALEHTGPISTLLPSIWDRRRPRLGFWVYKKGATNKFSMKISNLEVRRIENYGVCEYQKDKDFQTDPPKLLLEPHPDASGFEGPYFYVRILVHKRYQLHKTGSWWSVNFKNPTTGATTPMPSQCYRKLTGQELLDDDATLAAKGTAGWRVVSSRTNPFCYDVLEFFAPTFKHVSSCQWSSSGAHLTVPPTWVYMYGLVVLDTTEDFPVSCLPWQNYYSSSSSFEPAHCNMKLTRRTANWNLPLQVQFNLMHTTDPQEGVVTIYDEATKISVLVDQSTTVGTLDPMTGLWSDLRMDGKLRTFVNWPYVLVKPTLHGKELLSIEPSFLSENGIEKPIMTEVSTPFQTMKCYSIAQPPSGQMRTCIQEWKIAVKASAAGLSPPQVQQLLADVIIVFQAHAVNRVIDDYLLPPFPVKMDSGSLVPHVADRIDSKDLTVKLKGCTQEMDPEDFSCPTPAIDNNKYVKSSRSNPVDTEYFYDPQTAYFAVIPTLTKGQLAWCQLFKVIAYPQGTSAAEPYGVTLFHRKDDMVETVDSVVFDAENDPNNIWLSYPSDVDGTNKNTKRACLFSFKVLKEYFSPPQRSWAKWNIEATVWIKAVGVLMAQTQSAHSPEVQMLTVKLSANPQSGPSNATSQFVTSIEIDTEDSVTGGGACPYAEASKDTTTALGAGLGAGLGGLVLGAVIGVAWYSAINKRGAAKLKKMGQMPTSSVQMGSTASGVHTAVPAEHVPDVPNDI